MAMTSDTNHNSNRVSGLCGKDGLNSTQKPKNLLLWSKVVQGDSESVLSVNNMPTSSQPPQTPSSQPQQTPSPLTLPQEQLPPPADDFVIKESKESSDGNIGNANKPKKIAWEKPSNGVSKINVMGATSWPALSESTKPSPKTSGSESSSKTVSDGSTPLPDCQGAVIQNSPNKGNAKPNSPPNHVLSTRHRSTKHSGGGGGGSSSGIGNSQNNFTHPPMPPPMPPMPPAVSQMVQNSHASFPPVVPDQSPRELSFRGNNWEPRIGGFAPQPHVGNDHRHLSRRGNFRPRGDGPYHNNVGRRCDQEHQGNTKDVQLHPRGAPPRGLVRPPPLNAATFAPSHSQHMRPFPTPTGVPYFVSYPAFPWEPYRASSFITYGPVPSTMLFTVSEHTLPAMLVHQIEYYFSDANLFKDEFLKSNMDNQGWVPISLIAGFNRVRSMTSDVYLIQDSLRNSTVLEAQDGKVRRRNDWMNWIPNRGAESPSSLTYTALATSLQKISVKEAAANLSPQSEDPSRIHSFDSTIQSPISQQDSTEVTSQT